MMRPNTMFDDETATIIRYHCSKVGYSVAKYVEMVVRKDIENKYPELMNAIKKETIRKQLGSTGLFQNERCSYEELLHVEVYHII